MSVSYVEMDQNPPLTIETYIQILQNETIVLLTVVICSEITHNTLAFEVRWGV